MRYALFALAALGGSVLATSFANLASPRTATTFDPAAQGTPKFRWKRGGNLYGVSMVDGSHGWTSEDGGRVRTYDGTGWSLIATPDAVRNDLKDVMFIDSSTGWVVGLGGVALKTTNGGSSWTSITVNDTYGAADLWSVYVASASEVWVGGDAPGSTPGSRVTVLKHTTNSGSSWSDASYSFTVPTGAKVYSIDFDPGTTHGIAGAEDELLMYTSDGATWAQSTLTTAPPAPPSGEEPFEFWVVKVKASSEAYAVGGQGVGVGAIYHSTSTALGRVWDKETSFTYTGGANCVSCPDPPGPSIAPASCEGGTSNATFYGLTLFPGNSTTVAAAVAYGSQIQVRVSGTWAEKSDHCEQVSNPAFNHVSAIPGSPSTTAWAVGQFGQIRKTTDAFDNWTHQLDSIFFRTYGLWFEDVDSGWIVGQNRQIAKTSNGSADKPGWSIQHPTTTYTGAFETKNNLYGISMKPAVGGATLGVAVGSENDNINNPGAGTLKPLIATTADGSTWSELLFTPSNNAGPNLRDVKYRGTNDEWWAAGDAGLVLKGTYSGSAWTWTQVSIPSPNSGLWVSSVAANGTSEMFFGGAGGVVYKLALPGQTWTQITNSLTTADITDVVANAGKVIAVTKGTSTSPGRILVYRPGTGDFTEIVPPSGTLVNGQDLFSVDVQSSGTGYRLFLGTSTGVVVQYDSATATWTKPKTDTSMDVTAMHFMSDVVGFAVARQGIVIGFH